ncbi:hypothetical protein A2U01_0112436 [Trifolium medium]|uniref:Uncharacterized protein n=1 Tax=Trifolium medium TaxID=97028 RepID=A0A392VUL3_9FABA|nr:hypothetical protein [Trifolium medium]
MLQQHGQDMKYGVGRNNTLISPNGIVAETGYQTLVQSVGDGGQALN